MADSVLAQSAALAGGVGCVGVLLGRDRAVVLSSIALLAVAEGALGFAVVPSHDLTRLHTPPTHALGLAIAVIGVLGLSLVFVRYSSAAPVALVLAAPLRISVTLGSEHAMLLLPFYGVLTSEILAFVWLSLKDEITFRVSPMIALPSATLLALYAASLLWAHDVRGGSVELMAFLFPFAALVAVLSRRAFPRRLKRALAITVVAQGVSFAGFGIWEEIVHRVFFSPFLEVSNAYTTFFRTNSLFYDPNIYGRQVVVTLGVVVAIMWCGKFWPLFGLSLVSFLWIALFFSYSQSSFAALFVAVLFATLAVSSQRVRYTIALGALACLLVGGVFVAVEARGHSFRRVSSDRSHLVSVTVAAFRRHPIVGVGVGSQSVASSEDSGSLGAAKYSASHTTPLTVAAELGVLGLLAYAAWLIAAGYGLRQVSRLDRTAGTTLSTIFAALLTHSLFYSGFFEDPIVWGIVAICAGSLAPSATSPSRRLGVSEG